MDVQYGADIHAAVDDLPVSALGMAAAVLHTVPAGAASVVERDHIANLLARRGPITPTQASHTLLSAWAMAGQPGATPGRVQGSSAWQSICALGLRDDALAALKFYEAIIRANTARWDRSSQ